MKVGNNEQKNVSMMNRTLFNVAKKILEDNQHPSHIGWSGVGKFVDYIETFYDLTPVDWKLDDFLEVDKSSLEDVGIVTAKGKGHLAEVLKSEGRAILDGEDKYTILKIVKDDRYFEETGNHKIVLQKV